MKDETTDPAVLAALAKLERATAAYRRAETRVNERRDLVHEAIVEAFLAGAKPSQVEQRAPYDRNHVGRIRKAAGIPPTRESTVVSKREADRGKR